MRDLGLRVVSGDIFQKDSLIGPTDSGPPAREKKSLWGWLSHLALLCLADSEGWNHAIFLFR